MKTPINILAMLLAALLMAGAAHAAEITIWYDEEGVPHVTREPESVVPPEPPAPEVREPQTPRRTTPRSRPQIAAPSAAPGAAPGAAPNVRPPEPSPAGRETDIDAAMDEGRRLAASPYLYNEGLGLYKPFTFQYEKRVTEEVNGEPRIRYENTQLAAYLFVGTTYNMVKARAAVSASLGRGVTSTYIEQVKAMDRLPVAFYAAGFEPGVMLLKQKGKFVTGEEGFGEPDPGIAKAMLAKNFPLAALDMSAPAQVEVYDRDGKMLMFEVDLSLYR